MLPEELFESINATNILPCKGFSLSTGSLHRGGKWRTIQAHPLMEESRTGSN